MAARENQGLQIALIIFVILTIMLIVTSYFVFSGYTKERDRANAMAKGKSDADTAASRAIGEADDIKQIIGGDAKLTVDNVRETAQADLQTHGEGLSETKQNYRALVQHMADKLRRYEEMNTKLTDETKDLNAKLKANQDAALAEVAQYKSKLDATAADLESERTKFGAARTEISGQMEQIASKFQTTEAEREKLAAQSAGQIASLSTDLKRNEELLRRHIDKAAADEKANEYPDGAVTRVNQRTRLVWLNIGSADGLRNSTSFVVVSPEDGNPIKSTPKGTIQVVRLTGDHQAEARILDDDLSNPIMPGDNIFSTVWDARRPEHFALAGRMDLDGDGSDDRQLVQNLITINGGIVDAQVDDQGNKSGQMTIDTKYLIVGSRPEPGDKDIEGYSAMISEGQKLGIKEMDVHEFVKYMGYKGGERTVKLGQGANSADFKPRMPEDVQRTIRGTGQPQELRRDRAAMPPRN